MKIVLLAAAGAAVLLVPAALAGHSSARTTTLQGTVGPGYTITLKKAGVKVGKLKAGTYVIVVADKAADHNFHLTGPGVNKTTSIGGKSTSMWTVKLKPGTYRYICDPHQSVMHGSVSVS